MTQFDYGAIDPNVKNGTELASDLNSARDAWNTLHRGDSIPLYAQGGTLWLDDTTTTWKLKLYDGADDITLFDIDTTANTAIFSGDSIALTDSGEATTFSAVRTGAVPTVSIAVFEDQAPANNFSNVEIKAHRPGLIFRDTTASADDFRLGLDGNTLKFSVDTDDDDTRDSAGHFDDFTNTFVLDGSSGNIGIGREPTQSFDIGISKSGADMRVMFENTSVTAASTTTLHLKGNSGTSTGKQIIAFNGDTSGFTLGWDEAGDTGDGFFRLAPSVDQDITDSDGGLYIDDLGRLGIGFIGDARAGLIRSDLHIAVGFGFPTILLETMDASVTPNDIVSEIATIGGEAGGQDVVGSIRVEADEAWDATSSGTHMVFHTTPNTALIAVETMRLDNAGRLKLGGNFSELLADGLHIESASAGAISPAAGADEFILEGSGNTGMTIFSGITSKGNVYFGDSDSGLSGRLTYDHNTDRMTFFAAGVERLRLDSVTSEFNSGNGNVDFIVNSTVADAFRVIADGGLAGDGLIEANVAFEMDAEWIMGASGRVTTTTDVNEELTLADGVHTVTLSANTNLDGIIGGVDGQMLFIRAGLVVNITVRDDQSQVGGGSPIHTRNNSSYVITANEIGCLVKFGSAWYLLFPTDSVT